MEEQKGFSGRLPELSSPGMSWGESGTANVIPIPPVISLSMWPFCVQLLLLFVSNPYAIVCPMVWGDIGKIVHYFEKCMAMEVQWLCYKHGFTVVHVWCLHTTSARCWLKAIAIVYTKAWYTKPQVQRFYIIYIAFMKSPFLACIYKALPSEPEWSWK